jgi:hypothetical protein
MSGYKDINLLDDWGSFEQIGRFLCPRGSSQKMSLPPCLVWEGIKDAIGCRCQAKCVPSSCSWCFLDCLQCFFFEEALSRSLFSWPCREANERSDLHAVSFPWKFGRKHVSHLEDGWHCEQLVMSFR